MRPSRGFAAASLGVIALAVIVRGPVPSGRLSAQAARSITLSIVGTNDFHGSFQAREGRGGLAAFAGYVKNLREARASDGGAVLLIDAGDMFQGTVESNLDEGATVVDAYNLLGYAAAAIGNHEFDFGPVGPAATPQIPADDPRGALKARAAQAHFPLLAANIIDEATGKSVAWPNVKPSVIVAAAGIKVGIIGVITSDLFKTSIAANTKGLRLAPLAGAIAAEATRLRLSGATVIIVAAHAGAKCTKFDNPADVSSCDNGEIIEVAHALPAALVDEIVAGHVHEGIAHVVHGIAITESYNGGRSFGRVDLEIDPFTKRPIEKHVFPPQDICERENPATHQCAAQEKGVASVAPIYEGKTVVEDAAIAKMIAPTVAAGAPVKAKRLELVFDTPVRRALIRGESPLGNFYTDSMLAASPGADVAIYDTGSLRIDLPAGPLTWGNFYELSPYQNVLMRLHITGAELRNMVTAELQRPKMNMLIAGFRVKAECTKGALAVTLLRTGDRAIKDTDPIEVATVDFLATGGDDIFVPITPPQGFTIPHDVPLVRDAVADFIQRRGGHTSEGSLMNAKRPRWSYPGALPVKCPAK
jgi:5'-nucleotidase